MPEDTESEANESNLDRRTMLKGAAAAGLAGTGFAGSASASDYNEITFCSVGEETFSYMVAVTGEVKRGGTYETDAGDEILSKGSARGATSEGRCDSWLFTGKPTKLELDGPGKVFVNGKLFKDTTKPEPKKLSNHVRIEAEGKLVEYKFRVSGQVAKAGEADAGDEIIDSNVVRGTVGGDGVDSFRYSGAIAFDEADGPLTVTLDINP